MRKIVLLALIFSWAISSASWAAKPQKLTNPQKRAAREAVRALRKLHDSLGVAQTYNQYSNRVVDTAALVRNRQRGIPAGAVKTNLTKAIGAYDDARTIWKTALGFDGDAMMTWAMAKTLYQKKYPNIKWPTDKQIKDMSPNKVNLNYTLEPFWGTAQAFTEWAAAGVGKP